MSFPFETKHVLVPSSSLTSKNSKMAHSVGKNVHYIVGQQFVTNSRGIEKYNYFRNVSEDWYLKN